MNDQTCHNCSRRIAKQADTDLPRFCSHCGVKLIEDAEPEIERLFAQAKELQGPDREAFLSRECESREDLRRRLLELLKASDSGGGMLDTLLEQRPAYPERVTESFAGTVVDKYKLLQQIGEGGFGVVYMAEQIRPVKRKVALKVVKPGMDSKAVMARFEAERQALAMMEHPHIASVFDGGTTKEGRPYFVMELVKGVPITTYCDDNKLCISERLHLFISTCEAVQHAHQKGVIHRDIKPSNVLVTLHDGKPVVKVIDFGVAKAMHSELTEKTLFTAYGQMIGTPQYMSPEQAEMSGLDVDTRSDIYSLAVLLYELLTGTTPLEANKLKAAGLAGLQRLIKETEPPKPSTRVSSIGHRLTHIAAERSVEPDRLRHEIQGDLDWIVMKALDKDRSRRYETATGLATDITRFLNDEPVTARPPSTIYQLQKFSRRHRSLAWTVGLVSTALVVGLLASIWGLSKARQGRISAQVEREAAQEASDRANHLAKNLQKQKEKAERSKKEAEDEREKAVGDFYATQIFSRSKAPDERRGQRRLGNTLYQWRPKTPDATDYRGWEWYYLSGLRTPSVQTLCDEPAYSASWSPVDDRIASTFFDGTMRIHNLAEPSSEVHFQAHQSPAIMARWHDSGKWLATVAMHGEVAIWDSETWSLIRRIHGDATLVSWSPIAPRIAVVGKSNVRIIDILEPSGFKQVDATTLTVAWSHDGKWLASDIELGRFGILDVDSTQWVHTSEFDGKEIFVSKSRHRLRDNPGATPFYWTADHLIAATHDSFRHVAISDWSESRVDVEGELEIRVGHWSPSTGEFMTNDSPLSGFQDYQLYDPTTGKRRAERPLDSESYGGSWSDDGKKFAYSTRHATIYVCNAKMKLMQEFTRLSSGPGPVQWNHLNDKLLAVSDKVQVISTEETLADAIPKPDFWSMSSDGLSILTNDIGQRELVVRDCLTGRQRFALQSPLELSGALWSPHNNRWIAAVAMNGKEVVVWDTESQLVHATLPADLVPGHRHEFPSVGLAWTKDDSLAVANVSTMQSKFVEASIDIWHVPTKSRTHRIPLPTGELSRMAFDPTGNHIATVPASWVDVFDITRQGSESKRLPGHTSWERNSTYVEDIRWSPSGDRIATVSLDGTVCIWNSRTLERIHSLDAHTHYVMTVSWSPDSKRLATGDRGGNILIWDPEAGRAVMQIARARGQVERIAWSQDSLRLIASFEEEEHLAVFDASKAYVEARQVEAVPLLNYRITKTLTISDLLARAEIHLENPDHRQNTLRDLDQAVNLLMAEARPKSRWKSTRRNRAELLRCICLAESHRIDDAKRSWLSVKNRGVDHVSESLSKPGANDVIDIGSCIDAYGHLVTSDGRQNSDAVALAHARLPEIPALESIFGTLQLEQGQYLAAVQHLEKASRKMSSRLTEQELRNAKMRLFKVVYWWKLANEKSEDSRSVWSILLDELGFRSESQQVPFTAKAVTDIAKYVEWLERPVEAETHFWIALAEAKQGNFEAAHEAYKDGVEWMRLQWDIVDNHTLHIRTRAALAVFAAEFPGQEP